MNCQQFQEIASEWIELRALATPASQIHVPEHPERTYRMAEVEAYLKGCASCRRLVEDLEAIQVAAAEAFHDEAEPSGMVWINLRERLVSEGLIREQVPTLVPGRWSWKERIAGLFPTLVRPALAGSYILVLVLGAALVGLESLIGVGDVLPRDAAGPSLNAQLRQAENRTLTAMQNRNPVVAASLSSNLAVVDKFIGLCEKAVQEDPNNELAREYLFNAYQQKADLLARIVDQGITGE